jgi:hypothetical protein
LPFKSSSFPESTFWSGGGTLVDVVEVLLVEDVLVDVEVVDVDDETLLDVVVVVSVMVVAPTVVEVSVLVVTVVVMVTVPVMVVVTVVVVSVVLVVVVPASVVVVQTGLPVAPALFVGVGHASAKSALLLLVVDMRVRLSVESLAVSGVGVPTYDGVFVPV